MRNGSAQSMDDKEALNEWHTLLHHYKTASSEQRQALRLDFLRLAVADMAILTQEEAAHFLAEEIQSKDFASLDWESAEMILLFCDQLYTLPLSNPELRTNVRDHVHTLLRQVLQKYESEEKHEQLFTGVQVTPTFAHWDDEELKRLHHLASRYEFKRVTRNRRLLYSYLLGQIIFVVVFFPLLFINAENGALQAQVEALTDVEMGDEGYQLLTYADALYWSIITATSIGYGDITPTTTTGRIIAAVLGTMGVITVAIIAGLVLDWITPRRLD
jgi:Ion channel